MHRVLVLTPRCRRGTPTRWQWLCTGGIRTMSTVLPDSRVVRSAGVNFAERGRYASVIRLRREPGMLLLWSMHCMLQGLAYIPAGKRLYCAAYRRAFPYSRLPYMRYALRYSLWCSLLPSFSPGHTGLWNWASTLTPDDCYGCPT